MDNKFIPNSFQVPNALIDELIAELSGAELKVYLFVIRKTKGWNKESDAISISQFMEALNLSNRAVINACKSLIEKGLIVQNIGIRGVKVYSVDLCKKFTSEESSHVKKVHSTCEKSSQDLVKKVHTQNNTIKNTTKNTIKKTTQKKSQSALDILAEFGIDGQLADDFIEHRKLLKAPITRTALEGFQREAGRAQIPIQQSIRISIERGWRGFRADWNGICSNQTTPPKNKFSDDDISWAKGKTITVRGDFEW